MLLVLISAGSLTACSLGGADAGQPALLDEKEILAEYSAETDRLELAPGDVWDPRPQQLTADSPGPEGPMKFERGVGEQTAQFQWYCSWAKHALADEGAAQDAFVHLNKFPTLSVWDAMDENGHALFTGISEGAARGQLDELADYVDDNCETSDAVRDATGQ
ncbi:hypothetical protein GL263_24475 [Streptomyces durbertensis]|uniref:Lipoprotein n=1 Tax=Streptomyces durbertensis TaxID=2448886 RepID=A0ABR6EMW0_9ACTN|nr:hypothetical protein [Streptomyces durbertensis]MBB1246682.1 hypothetical protein [Streptomyces durbertensis]